MNQADAEVRRDKIVAFVAHYRAQYNVGPSYSEIAKNVGFGSAAAARKACEILIQRGKLGKYDGISRSLFVPNISE